LDFDSAVAHIRGLIGTEVSVDVAGNDPEGAGTVAELTGVLRAVGPDPDDRGASGSEAPEVFSFEGQDNAFYLDRDAFVAAWSADRFLRVTTTFGSIEIAGPIRRPPWF